MKYWLLIVAILLVACSPKVAPEVTSFEDCVAAGNAVMESYPRQCNTVDGKHFVEDVEPVETGQPLPPVTDEDSSRPVDETGGGFCTMDAKQCPDGSYVGRQGPNCEFAPCPGE